MSQLVYVVSHGSRWGEDKELDSIWSGKELAEARKHALSAQHGKGETYWLEEFEMDKAEGNSGE